MRAALSQTEHRLAGHSGTLPHEHRPHDIPPRAIPEGLIVIVSCLEVANPQANYESSAAAAHALCVTRPEDLVACELRTASLLFQIKGALGNTAARDKTAAWKQCAACPALMSAFLADTVRGQTFIRGRLAGHPDDEGPLFFLGKVGLNDVWLQLGMLGRKTGWDEYWEARRSLDRVLEMNSVREAAERGDGEFFDRVEAMFALWDMQVRERELTGAVATARKLAHHSPENRELRKFLTMHEP